MNYKNNKILIIKPYYIAWPIGLAYVLATLDENDIPFDFIDLNKIKNWQQKIRNLIVERKYLAIASGGLIGFYKFFKEISNIVLDSNLNIPFILGGNIIKDASDSFLFDEIGITFGILGEAETSFPMLLQAIENGNDEFDSLSGIIYKNKDGNIIRNKPKRLDLKKTNIIPAWDYFDVSYYIEKGSSPFLPRNLKFMPVLSGRGCIGQCAFCSPTIGGFRKRLMKDVIDEIQELINQYNFDIIMFYNEMFYTTVKEINEFCKLYNSMVNKKKWVTAVRIDSNIDVETFLNMRNAGCIAVSAGIESGSDAVLERMNKKIVTDQIRAFCRNARQAKMPISGTFIVGFEGETEEDLKKTIDLLIEEEINSDASLMFVYPGTKVYENARSKGLIKNEIEQLERWRDFPRLFALNTSGAYLNISGIPDISFYDIATREVRRYYTFLFDRYLVKNLTCAVETKRFEIDIVLTGNCVECGNEVKYSYEVFRRNEYKGALGIGVSDRNICPDCLSPLTFNIYTSKNLKNELQYLTFLKTTLATKKKILIGGMGISANTDAMFILRINLFNMNYENIIGYVDFSREYKGKFYANYSVIDVNSITKINPDFILLVDSIQESKKIIYNIYKKEGKKIPEIYYLFSKRFLTFINKGRNKISYIFFNNQIRNNIRKNRMISFIWEKVKGQRKK